MQIYGIDLAMEKFDVNFVNKNKEEKHLVVSNKLSAIVKFLNKIPKGAIICAEHTGVYGNLLLFLCNQLNIPISLNPGYNIKHSLGLLKGKSDKLDAKRIREYGERFFDKLVLTKYEPETLIELNELYILRAQFIKQKRMLTSHVKAKKHNPYNSISAQNQAAKVMATFDESIKKLEKDMLLLIESDKHLKYSFDLSTSVTGIGPITTSELIIKTGNFKKINTSKKAASFAGVCPFPNSTGKMVKKDRVSKMSDKSLKTLLHLCARSAVLYNKEFRLYYQKKQLEGKHHFVIMNNVSNKLLRMIYSIIESGIPYDPNYVCIDPRNREKVV